MRAAANNVKKLSLELGGKSPNIVFPDAQIPRLPLPGRSSASTSTAARCATAGSRLLVSNQVKDDTFVTKLAGMGASA